MGQPGLPPSVSQRENTPWLGRFRDVLLPGLWVLDLGCGTGDDSLELAAFGCHVVALDFQIDRVRQVPSQGGVQLRIVADLANGLPFRDSSFSCVSASLSLHYFDSESTRLAIADITRILRPQGHLVCRVNAVGDMNFGYGQGEKVEPELFRQPEGHLKRFFDQAMLEQFLGSCFTLESIVPRTIVQHGLEKRTLECLACKR